jgi:DNA-directed RNA polymerase specialized sigma subunit
MPMLLGEEVNLSDRCVEVCSLRYNDRMTVEDIADRLRLCPQRVSQHLKTARKRYPALEDREQVLWGRRRRKSMAQTA